MAGVIAGPSGRVLLALLGGSRKNGMCELYVIEIYCRNEACAVRQSRVFTKNHGDTPTPKEWRCPGCGGTAVVHWKRSLQEHEHHETLSAIGRVNAALYVRDFGSPAVPVSYLMRETLPDSWKSEDVERLRK